MNPWLLVAAAGAATLAAGAAAADGALRAAERQRLREAMPAGVAPEAGRVRSSDGAGDGGVRAAHDRSWRALGFARLLAHLCAGFAIGILLRDAGSQPHHVALAVLLGLVIVLVAETAARAWGDARGPGLLVALGPLVRLVEVGVAPVAALALALDRRLTRTLPTPRAGELEREATAEQFRQVVAAEADVSRASAALLQGVFSLADTETHEVMVPRVDIVGIEVDTPWSEVLDRVRASEHSRFPVFENTLDDIAGVLHAKDLLPYIVADEEPADGWPALVRPATFVPRTKSIGDQLRDFRATGTHIAFVADEFGGTAGLVTLEDVLEEIVGEIRDEYDEEEPEIEVEGDDRFWVAGRVTLEELGERMGVELARDDVSTVGGLVYDHLGRVPRAGERFELAGCRVVVERVVRRQVRRVYFERLPADGQADG